MKNCWSHSQLSQGYHDCRRRNRLCKVHGQESGTRLLGRCSPGPPSSACAQLGLGGGTDGYLSSSSPLSRTLPIFYFKSKANRCCKAHVEYLRSKFHTGVSDFENSKFFSCYERHHANLKFISAILFFSRCIVTLIVYLCSEVWFHNFLSILFQRLWISFFISMFAIHENYIHLGELVHIHIPSPSFLVPCSLHECLFCISLKT